MGGLCLVVADMEFVKKFTQGRVLISILYIFLQSIYYFTRPRALTGDGKFVIVHETIE